MTQPAFVDLLNHPDYEILNEFPFTIRKKANHYELKESSNKGYLTVTVDGKNCRKHRLIALQFLPNPNNYTQVDHINHNRRDNHLDNLRWISHSDNSRNKSSYKGVPSRYVDEIDHEALVCDYYDTKTERHLFKDYYYHEGVFYYDTNANYRVLNVNTTKSGSRYVCMRSTDGKQISVYIERFLDQHDML